MRHLVRSSIIVVAVWLSGAANAADVRPIDADVRSIDIYSEGIRMAGNVFTPAGVDAAGKRPGVLLVHGWGGVKSHLNQAYAPAFADAGYVVLTFDYRGWGESDGIVVRTGKRPETVNDDGEGTTYDTTVRELRTIVNPLEQMDDIRAAMAYLTSEPNVDASRIAVWGTSLGGGLALRTATEFDDVRVLLVQVGAVNTQAGFENVPESNPTSAAAMARMRAGIARGEIPSVPSVATPGLRGFPHWPDFVRHDPYQHLDRLDAATLIVDADAEELFDIKRNGHDLYTRIKDRMPARYETISGKHYDVYSGKGYEKAVKWQLDWLGKHLPID